MADNGGRKRRRGGYDDGEDDNGPGNVDVMADAAPLADDANASRQKKREAPSAMWEGDMEALKELVLQTIVSILEQTETRSVSPFHAAVAFV